MQCALPTQFIFFYLLVSLSLTDSFQNSLKTRVKLQKKMRIRCPKTVCVGVEETGRRRENGGNSAMVVGVDRRPWIYRGGVRGVVGIGGFNFNSHTTINPSHGMKQLQIQTMFCY